MTTIGRATTLTLSVRCLFDLKLQALLKQLRGGILGRQRAILHTIEWQKCDLPHAHILLWVVPADKPRAAGSTRTRTGRVRVR